MKFFSIRKLVVVGAVAGLVAVSACSDASAPGTTEPAVVTSSPGSTAADQAGNSDGAPFKAMEITEPDADHNAVCNLFTPDEVQPMTGELVSLGEGLTNPVNDKYLGGRINSCVWYGDKTVLHLVITSDGNAGAMYRNYAGKVDNPQHPMCNGHPGSTGTQAICVFGDVMYLVLAEAPTLAEANTYTPPTDRQIATFMHEALARTGGESSAGQDSSGTATTLTGGPNCDLVSADEVTQILGSQASLDTRYESCFYVAEDDGLQLIVRVESSSSLPDPKYIGKTYDDPYPGCQYIRTNPQMVQAYCTPSGYSFEGSFYGGEIWAKPRSKRSPSL